MIYRFILTVQIKSKGDFKNVELLNIYKNKIPKRKVKLLLVSFNYYIQSMLCLDTKQHGWTFS